MIHGKENHNEVCSVFCDRLVCCVGFAGEAQAIDGSELLALCNVGRSGESSTPENPGLGRLWASGLCEGYVLGVIDMFRAGKTDCLPDCNGTLLT